MKELPAWVTIGAVNGAHGIRGEIKVFPLTDDVQRFLVLKSIKITGPNQAEQTYTIKNVRVNSKGLALLKVDGIDDRNAAEKLKGCLVSIPRELCPELDADQYYHFELLGLRVETTTGEYLGEIADILEMPASDVYVVRNSEREVLIPAVRQIVKEVSIEPGKNDNRIIGRFNRLDMDIHVVAAFPEMVSAPLEKSILQRARDKDLVQYHFYDLRNFTRDKHRQIDDYPYGGGPGMVLKPEPIIRCVDAIIAELGDAPYRIILPTPQGPTFNQQMAQDFLDEDNLILICGHYKGIDERVMQYFNPR